MGADAESGAASGGDRFLRFVGFGKYIQENEPETLAALDRIFSGLIIPSLARYRGHLFKMLGDRALV